MVFTSISVKLALKLFAGGGADDVLSTDVVEVNADVNQAESGNRFIIDNKYPYVDLDDLLVNHVKAMSRKADDLMSHDKYKGASTEELREFISVAGVVDKLIREGRALSAEFCQNEPYPVFICIWP